jgi:hypothetical protein
MPDDTANEDAAIAAARIDMRAAVEPQRSQGG